MTAPTKTEVCAACHGELAAWTVHVGDVVYCSAYCRDHAPGDVMASAPVATTPTDELTAIVSELGTDERRVLLVLARRLLNGQSKYGRLDVTKDPRDWRHEQAEEMEDMLVYSAIADVAAATR
ncbi:MAG: hypothetical protein ABTD50_23345 [Polyangiaceae bacterium]